MGLNVEPSHMNLTAAVASLRGKHRNQAKLRLVLAITSTGRREILSETLRALALQTRRPDLIVLSVASEEDFDAALVQNLVASSVVVSGPKGGCAQRNRVLEMLRPDDIVMMTDDDFLMAPDYLEQAMRLFAARPDMVMATGKVLADGICGPGYDHAEGRRHLGSARGDSTAAVQPAYNAYGCNMAIRAYPELQNKLRYDERLPLYGWLEDVDFSRRLAAYGQIIRSPALVGVHLGTKTGRQSGLRLGYSQIANPLYLIGKGSIDRRLAFRLMARNVAANVLHAARPEPWVDRRGRLKGNLLAVFELIRGRLAPERVLELG